MSRRDRAHHPNIALVAAAVIGLGALVGFVLDDRRSRLNGPQDRVPITLAAAVNEASVLVWLAADLGFFEQAGLDATVNAYAFGRPAAEAMLAGEADVATAAEFVVVRENFERDNLMVLGSISESHSFYLVGRRDRGIAAPADLRGRRIAVAVGTQAEFFLDRFLAFNDIENDALQVVDLTPDEMVEQVMNGDIDALAALDPHAYAARVRLGDDATVFPGHVDDIHHFLLVATAEWVAANPQVTDRLLRALAMAQDFNERNPQGAQAVIRARFGRSPAYLSHTWQMRRFALALPQSLVSTLEQQAVWAVERGLVCHDRLPDYLPILHPDALAAIAPSAVTVIH